MQNKSHPELFTDFNVLEINVFELRKRTQEIAGAGGLNLKIRLAPVSFLLKMIEFLGIFQILF